MEDNLWALQTAQSDPIMVGVIGNLRIEAPDFPEIFARHAKNPLLRGLRYGNLWRSDIVAQSQRPEFIAGLKAGVRRRPRARHRQSAGRPAPGGGAPQRRRCPTCAS